MTGELLTLAMIIFLLGVLGMILNSSNIMVLMMSMELMLLAVNLNFITYSTLLDDWIGQGLGMWMLTVAASESAMGLAILVAYYRVSGTMAVMYINLIKG